MNTKYTYRWTNNYFEDANNNETDYIITDGVYDFEDWLTDSIRRNTDSNYSVEVEDDYYYILDGCNERTGEMYVVLNKEATDEDLVG